MGLGVLGWVRGVSSRVLGVRLVRDRFICDGVGVLSGAGSAHSSEGDWSDFEVVGVRESRISEGVGVGAGAASAHSSLLALALGLIGVLTLAMSIDGDARDSVVEMGVVVVEMEVVVVDMGVAVIEVEVVGVEVEVVVVEMGVAGVGVEVVGGFSRRRFSFRRLSFACRISCRRLIN